MSSSAFPRDAQEILECSVEGYLCRSVKALGGQAFKMPADLYAGIPDRLVVLPGRIAFCECKRPVGGRLSVRQKLWKKILTGLGASWHLLCTRDDVDQFLGAENDD